MKPNNTTTPETPVMTNPSDALMAELQKRIMGSSGAVSSSDSNIESTINKSVSALEQGKALGEQRINSDYQTAKSDILGTGESNVTDFTETRSGFGTQLATLRRLVGDTDKAMKDLDQRRQDALAMNDSNTATAIAKLQMDKLTFMQQKEKQFYDNAFATIGLDYQAKAQEQAKYEFKTMLEDRKLQRTFDREDKLMGLAAQAGVKFEAGDTMETLSGKIATIADEERKLKAQQAWAAMAKSTAKADEEEIYFEQYLPDPSKGFSSAEAYARAAVAQMAASGTITASQGRKLRETAMAAYSEYENIKNKKTAEAKGFFSGLFGGNSTGPVSNKYESTSPYPNNTQTTTPAPNGFLPVTF